ncbi:ABC transporter ATP-binding protein [Kitasatospora indigofera]|uniref:ABC transporter ATP-binding protein n=1 Tax=Kitasatospora indigofera TaxID=67307 RepID=UPI0036762F48
MTEPVVEVDRLRVEVDGRALVDEVSLQVHPGRVTALVGASGSGKTTTGLALLGEYPAGARVDGKVSTLVGGIGYIPQNPTFALNPARRVGALLRDIARLRGQGDPEVCEALRRAHLTDPEAVLRRYPHQLSGGQQQRVVLAQALLRGARVIVADEPTTGQDALTKQRLTEELASVVRQGIGLLLLSHDIDMVDNLADSIVVLSGGRMVDPDPTRGKTTRSRRHPHLLESSAAPRRQTASAPRVLTVEALDAGYPGGVRALHRVSLEVGAGECLALVGRSGSGKTTLGRCAAGLHSAYLGRVLLDGRPLAPSLRQRSRAELAAVQYVFQDARASFDEGRPLLAQVARAAVRLRGAGHGEATQEALEFLARVGLSEDHSARPPRGLSGGELQRAALARALVARPRVLICDEITSGLDAASRYAVLDLLAGLRRRSDLALVLITHDLTAAGTVSDRIAVIDQGRIVEQGRTAQVLATPSHAFTRQLLGSVGLGTAIGARCRTVEP